MVLNALTDSDYSNCPMQRMCLITQRPQPQGRRSTMERPVAGSVVD